MIYSLKHLTRKLNWRVIGNVLGYVLLAEAGLMLLPLICCLIYGEANAAMSFVITILICAPLGFIMSRLKVKHTSYYTRDGLFAVGLCWIVASLFGALPFYISHAIPSYVDCFFETVSGFTTTGSSILTEVESLPKGILFWRSFTHWVGGMGILVFVLAIVPKSNNRSIHILRAESPGTEVSKLVPRLRQSASILYKIYLGLTILEVIFLIAGKMPLFDALCNTFGSAGTGGFSVTNKGIGQYHNAYYEMVIGIFMAMFGINFNFYFLLLIKDFKDAFGMEEVKDYLRIIGIATLLIMINILPLTHHSLWDAFRLAFFQVSSIITTTGYSSTDFNLWPSFSKMILLLLMILGACEGSTGGGIKVSRFIIILKKIKQDILKNLHPQKVTVIKMNNKTVSPKVVDQITTFFCCYIAILAFSLLIVALDGFDLETTISACVSCLGNIGPGFGVCGPYGSFHAFSNLSKIILSFSMLIGRLEIYPILVFIAPLLVSHKSKTKA